MLAEIYLLKLEAAEHYQDFSVIFH